MASDSPIIYMIRHGEKPPKDADGKDPEGLSTRGLDRAQGLRQVFGKSSPYDIGYILAEKPKKNGERARPVETVTPLANDLGLTINDTISRDDADGAAAAAKACPGPGNVLVCWEHGQLALIAKAMGVKGYAPGVDSQNDGEKKSGKHGEKVDYPDDRFDLIWTVMDPYKEISSVTSEMVPGLDG